MRTTYKAATIVVATLTLCASPLRVQAVEADDGWSETDDDGFAKIETRAIADTKVRETRITATLKWPAGRLMALIGDVEHYPSFMPPTQEARVLDKQSANAGRYYIVIDPPVIHRRDYCVQIAISKLPDGRLQSRFRRSDEACPTEQSGLVRMTRVDGSWTLASLPDGTTRVVYQAVTDPAGIVPTWMVNRAAGGSVRDMFHALDRAAGDARISTCPGSGSIGCL